MKKYKPNYLFTVLFQSCNTLLSFFPGVLIIWIFQNPYDADSVLYIFPYYLLLILLLIVFGNIMHFTITLFSKHKVFIDKDSITIEGKKILTKSIKFEDVRFITFDHGRFSKSGGGEPCSLNLFNADYSTVLNITHPSFFMIWNIKQKCKNAKFSFNNYKWYLITCCVFTVASIIWCLCA